MYVDDAVEATVAIVERALRADESVRNEDFNIGSDTHYTILELGKLIWKMFGDGRKFKYTVNPVPSDTALRREVDITKIRERTGWQPTTSLAEGLESTALWIKSRKNS